MSDAPERIWATEDRENFGEDRFHATTPMRGLTEYLRADIAAAREADLRAIIGAYQDGTLPDLTAVHMGATLDARREIERLRGLLDEAQETRLRLDRRIHNQRARLHQLECALAHHLRSYYQAHIARVLGWDIPRLLRVKANARRATIAKIGGQHD